MSQFLNRALKPFVYKNVLKHYNNRKMVRWCSSAPVYPYILIDHLLNVGDSQDGAISRRSGSFGENEIIIKNKLLAKEVRNAMTMGFNQSGVNIDLTIKALLRDMYEVHLKIYYKPPGRTSKSVTVRLPPLPKGCQIQNLAMSSLPDLENEDWVVVIKLRSQLKLYRHKDLRWMDIETAHGLESSISPYSSLMYSKKDKRFYIPSPGGAYLCSFDQKFKKMDKLKYNLMWREAIPQDMLNEFEERDSFSRTDHLVESPSGEQFLISWYYGDEIGLYKGARTVMHRTKRFMVFKFEEQGINKENKRFHERIIHTENIGDVCIFLGHGEALCVPASSSPGLKRNCIYFVGNNYGVYDITAQTCTLFYTEDGPLRSTYFPYWPHPFSFTPH